MADLTQTITNTIQVMGVSPGTLWGEAVWGTSLWGADEDVWTGTDKWLTEDLGLSDAYGKDVQHTISESINLSSSIDPVMRAWGIWDYVFTKPTLQGEDQASNTYTKVSEPSTTYSEVTTDDTEWT